MDQDLGNNQELNAALQEFEAKSDGVAQVPQPSNVTDLSQGSYVAAEIPPDEAPKMAKWVMKLSGGLVKDETQANYILLGLVILIFCVSFYFFFGFGPPKANPGATNAGVNLLLPLPTQ